MPTRLFGSAKVSYPDHSREELIALLRERTAQLAHSLPLRRAVLFGSWASGRATAHSDVDVLIVYEGPAQDAAFALVRRTLGIRGLEPHIYNANEAEALAPTLERMIRDGVDLLH